MKHLFLAVVFLLSARLVQSAPIGAAVQTWHYDPQASIVTVRVVNTSQKDITAFNLSLKVTLQDGVSRYQWMHDLLNAAVLLDRFKGTSSDQHLREVFGEGAILVGGSYDEKIPITPNLKDFEAVIDVVAFSDKTAEAANTAALQRLIDQRKAMALSIQKANEIITNTTQDSTITNPHVVASVQVQKLLDAWKANPHYDGCNRH